MAVNRSNLIVGAAALFVAPGGTALPALTGTGSARTLMSAATGWREVGFTQEGIEVAYEPDFGEVEVDQFMGAAKLFKQNQTLTVNTTLAEATFENLLVTWGQNSSTLTGAAGAEILNISAGQLGDVPVERALVFIGPGPTIVTGGGTPVTQQLERIYYVPTAIQTESTSHALRKNEATVFPVSFRILPGNDGLFGSVRNRVVS